MRPALLGRALLGGKPELLGRKPTASLSARTGPVALLGVCWVAAPGWVLQLGGWLGHAWV